MNRFVTFSICLLFVSIPQGFKTADASETEPDKILSLIQDANKLAYTQPDSALSLYKDAYLMSLDHDADSLQMIAYLSISFFYNVTNNHHLSIEYALKALEILEETRIRVMNSQQLAWLLTLYSRLGYSFYCLDAKDLAREYLIRAMDLLEEVEILNPEAFSDQLKSYVISNMSAIYLDINELDLAYSTFKKIEDININLNDTTLMIGLNINKGIYFKEAGFLDSAMMAYNIARQFAENIKDKSFEARIYNNIGILHQLNNNIGEATSYFTLALNTAKEISAWKSVSIAAKALSEIYAESGDYRKAYEFSLLLVSLNDSIYSPLKNEQYTRMALQYNLDKKLRIHEATLSSLWKEQRNQKLMFLFLTVVLLLLVIIALIVIRLISRKVRLVSLEKDYASLRVKQLQSENKVTESELETSKHNLMEKAMWIVQQNELITEIASKLVSISKTLPDQQSKHLQQMIKQLESDKHEDFRKELEIRLSIVHKEFFQALNNNFPGLSPAEKKLASFLRLNLTTKEIAAITYQNADSLKVSRSRLRAKLGLGREENLVTFLENL